MGAERWKPSVTVAAVIEKDGRYLMIEEMTRDGLRINNPAGGLEPGESPIEGAMREALEETACHFTPQALLGVYLARNPDSERGPGVTYIRFAFCGTASDPVPGQALDSPVVRTLWMTADEVAAARDRLRGPLVRSGDDPPDTRHHALMTAVRKRGRREDGDVAPEPINRGYRARRAHCGG